MEHFDVVIIGLGPAGPGFAPKVHGKTPGWALDETHPGGR
ncbi:oxidoreductase [Escherichia coli]|nr:oxidoreductase [Escherichia coli]